ncbi:MAG TPA: Fic family protein, partial [Lactococcus sp.]|nr:Fic family protein [Lactococcus sp.]
MKTYSTLRAISYNDFENYPMIVEKRKESESSVFTGLFFQAFDTKQELLLKEEMELFFLVLPQTSLLKDKFNENSRQIDKLMNSLPEITKKNIFYHLLVEEIKASNDIEGVQSTRKEIRDAISVILEKSQEDKRFKSLVYQYMNFRKSKFSQITTI